MIRFTKSIKVSGKYKSSSPYGWIFESITRIDSVQLKKGDRFVLYTPELGGSLGSSWFVTDSTNSILKGIALGHATSSSGSSPSGLSNFSINSGGGGSSPGYMYEIRIPIPHDGKYYIRVNSSQYWPVGTTNATWDIGALYYEIN